MQQINSVILEGTIKEDIVYCRDGYFPTIKFTVKNEWSEICPGDSNLTAYRCDDIPIVMKVERGHEDFVLSHVTEGREVRIVGKLHVEHQEGKVYLFAEHVEYKPMFQADKED